MMTFTRRTLFAVVLTLGVVSAAQALMPPHVTGTDPADGGTLVGRVITITGYSLSYAKDSVTLTDTSTKKAVPFKSKIACKSEGDCGPDSPPGACQSKCTMTLTLDGVEKGQSLELKALRTVVRFTVGPEKAPVEKK